MTEVGLKITRNPGESWRDCAARYGRAEGLEFEVTQWFDDIMRYQPGVGEERAALEAVCEWDCCDLAFDGKTGTTTRHDGPSRASVNRPGWLKEEDK